MWTTSRSSRAADSIVLSTARTWRCRLRSQRCGVLSADIQRVTFCVAPRPHGAAWGSRFADSAGSSRAKLHPEAHGFHDETSSHRHVREGSGPTRTPLTAALFIAVLARSWFGGRDSADLAEQAEGIPVNPFFDELAIDDP